MPLIVDIKLKHPESQNVNRLPVGFKVLNPRNVGEEREGRRGKRLTKITTTRLTQISNQNTLAWITSYVATPRPWLKQTFQSIHKLEQANTAKAFVVAWWFEEHV